MALLSHMARIGSSQPVEIAGSLDEIADGFDLSHFGSAPTKFDEADLWPLTARVLHETSFEEVAGEIAALGVPDALARDFWEVARANIGTRADIPGWWALFRDGAAPVVAPEDRDFVAEAFAMLPDPPYDGETWGNWTTAVKEATGRKGKALFMPLRKAVTGLEKGPEMADVMRLLQKKPTL
jgi:glutamyl-tRNA synthetase